MKVRGECLWSFQPDLAHDKWLLFLHYGILGCFELTTLIVQVFQPGTVPPSRSLPKSLPCCRGWGPVRDRKLGRRDGKVLIIRASLYLCKDFLKLLLSYYSSHQTYMNLYSKELSTKTATYLIICCVGWGRFAVGCSSAAGFWANTGFLLWGECFLLYFPALTIHYSFLQLPPAPSLTFGKVTCLGFIAFFVCSDCCSKDEQEGKLLYGPLHGNLLKVIDLRWLLLLPSLTIASLHEI